ncbi:hypothetical protein BaRGS_00029295 [Batillaria attramentaria]|uniref:Uncharacterized protein n=1 Tax=Batillaria attramentaria TaxID=370345 RepID=A0ABD0JWK3_9CAEN
MAKVPAITTTKTPSFFTSLSVGSRNQRLQCLPTFVSKRNGNFPPLGERARQRGNRVDVWKSMALSLTHQCDGSAWAASSHISQHTTTHKVLFVVFPHITGSLAETDTERIQSPEKRISLSCIISQVSFTCRFLLKECLLFNGKKIFQLDHFRPTSDPLGTTSGKRQIL